MPCLPWRRNSRLIFRVFSGKSEGQYAANLGLPLVQVKDIVQTVADGKLTFAGDNYVMSYFAAQDEAEFCRKTRQRQASTSCSPSASTRVTRLDRCARPRATRRPIRQLSTCTQRAPARPSQPARRHPPRSAARRESRLPPKRLLHRCLPNRRSRRCWPKRRRQQLSSAASSVRRSATERATPASTDRQSRQQSVQARQATGLGVPDCVGAMPRASGIRDSCARAPQQALGQSGGGLLPHGAPIQGLRQGGALPHP